jgi:hypothetical protein
MAMNPQAYEVAISFIGADEPLAIQLLEVLQPPVSVFLYSKAQEELAGRDGIEAFRTVFKERAKLVVILYRPPWGETPWTRVEKQAIEEFAHESGWEHLLFVRLDKTPVPKWVPKPHLYLDLNTFTLADLAGAIKARLVEIGVEVAPVSPADRAAALARKQAYHEQTQAILRNGTAEFIGARDALFQAIELRAAEIAKSTGWDMRTGTGALIGGFVVTGQGQGLQLMQTDFYANAAHHAYLSLREYDSQLAVEQAGMVTYMMAPLEIVRRRRLDIRRVPELGWCWDLDGHTRPPAATADAVLNILIERIERAG